MNEPKGSRRKKILRVLAAALVFCLLFTYPNVPDILSVFAAGTQEDSVQADGAVQALLDSIAALPDSKEYLAEEPDAEAEEAYARWMEGLHQYAGEALGIQEAYDALAEEQQAQMPEETFTKLAAWAKIAEQLAGNDKVMLAAVAPTPGVISSDQEWSGGYLNALSAGTYTIKPGVTVTVTDTLVISENVTITGGGILKRAFEKGSADDSTHSIIHVDDGGKLTLNNVIIDGNNMSAQGPAVYITSCGKLFSDANGTTEITDVTIPALGHTHSLTKVNGKPATETKAGIKEHWKCSGCGKLFSDANGTIEITDVTIPALGHTHSLTKVNGKPATETEAGIKEHWKCSGCGKLFSDANGTIEITDVTIPALGHTHSLTKVNGKPATETEAGIKEHWKCSGCGKLFSDANGTIEITDVTIPATGSTSNPGGSSSSGRPSRPSHPQPDNGSITEEIQPGENAPGTKITTPLDELADIVLTPAEKAEVNDGTDITIILKIEDGTHLVPGSDKTKVETVIGGMQDYKLGQYLDVNLLKIIGSVTA